MAYIKQGRLDPSQLKFLVLDEADDLQKKDERADLPRLNDLIKRGRRDRVQTLFFSATLHSPEVQTLIDRICTRPIWVDLKGKDMVPDSVHMAMWELNAENDLPWKGSELVVRAKNPSASVPHDEVHSRDSMSATDRG